MLSTTRSIAALTRSTLLLLPNIYISIPQRGGLITLKAVKPSSTALMRAGPCAFISSSSTKSATTEIQPSSQNAQPGGPTLGVTRKPRREVPLPSQEKKEGAMQYALYVLHSRCSAFRTTRTIILGSHAHTHTYTHIISFFRPRPNVPSSPRMQPHITNFASTNTEQHSIKSPTGPARALSGP